MWKYTCEVKSFNCRDYKESLSFRFFYPIFIKYKIVNSIMTYDNVNQYKAKKLMKLKGITRCDQVEVILISSAFLA